MNRNRIDSALLIGLAMACAWGVTRVARSAGGASDASGPRMARSEAPPRPVESPAASADGPVEPPRVPIARVALGDPLPVASPSSVEPVIPPGAVALSVLRFPDRAPLAGAHVQVFAPGGRPVREAVVPPGGRLRLDDALLAHPEPLRVRVEHHEQAIVASRAWRGGIEYEALLRPTTGWIGRVVDSHGAPLAGTRVAGWWVERPRPFVNAVSPAVLAPEVARRLAPAQEDDAAPDGERAREDPPVQFIAAHAVLEATAPTDEEGWYYLPPLGGYVLGRLTLFADTERGSSSVLHVPLPDELGTRLPELVVHAVRPLRGVVVDPDGFPVAGARVLVELADGWSRTWLLTTDEDGAFAFTGPSCALAIAVEKVGYRIGQPAQWKPASADGMWSALEELVGPGRGAALYAEAYADWRAPLPRARGCARVEAGHSDVRIVLERLAPVAVDVFDAQWGFPIADARVVARFGGLDRRDVVARTGHDGRASVPGADREWQPSIVDVAADGYVPATVALAPSELASPLRVRLVSSELADALPLGWPAPPTGRVLGPDGEPLVARVAIHTADQERLWSGTSDREGRFPIALPPGAPVALRFFGATQGEVAYRGEIGPIGSEALLAGAQVVLRLDQSSECLVQVQGLESVRPYRLDWGLRPFEDGEPLVTGSLALSAPELGRVNVTIPVRPGWFLDAQLLGATVGSGPTMGLSEPDEERAYTSTRFTWTGWDVVARPWRARVPFDGGRLFFRAERLIDLSGTVEGLPADVERGTAWVAALGCGGSWFAPVSPRGWFDLRDVPAGSYRVVVFEQPAGEHGGSIHDVGRARGELEVGSEWSRHDLVVPWGE